MLSSHSLVQPDNVGVSDCLLLQLSATAAKEVPRYLMSDPTQRALRLAVTFLAVCGTL